MKGGTTWTVDTGLGENLKRFYVPLQGYGNNNNYGMYAFWWDGEPDRITVQQSLMSYGQAGTYYMHYPIDGNTSRNLYWHCISYYKGIFTMTLISHSSWPGTYTINWEAWDY